LTKTAHQPKEATPLRAMPGGVHGGAHPEQQAALLQQLIDGAQYVVGQLVLLQSVAKPQDGALTGQSAKGAQLGEFAVQRCVEEGFFHGRVRQAEPLLHEVHPQHGLQGEKEGDRCAPSCSTGR
jgi:hypothetical protein